jgi:hypothetical protein
VEGKDHLLLPKWDSLYKHACYKKLEKNIGIDVKKGDWYYFQRFLSMLKLGIAYFT